VASWLAIRSAYSNFNTPYALTTKAKWMPGESFDLRHRINRCLFLNKTRIASFSSEKQFEGLHLYAHRHIRRFVLEADSSNEGHASICLLVERIV